MAKETVVRKSIFFRDADGSEPVKDWLDNLKAKRKLDEYSKIGTRIRRAESGNFGDYRMLTGTVGELKIDIGPGYRVYFGLKGNELIILLSAGNKSSQTLDIELAKARWEKYLKEMTDGSK